jgi:23S rRNA (adenine2030-N6)-methyltransferase
MNYRHHFHAGNYADVFKHVLLVQLVRALQRKEKGFLYLDTHAGRGSYDLSATTALPGGRERQAEWPDGIGRIWRENAGPLRDYLTLVHQFNLERGGLAETPGYYPGSPWVAKRLLRPQDRMALCELRPDDAEALDFEFARESRATVQAIDGYTGIKALLPPAEKRALVLIDPPFENRAEFADVLRGIGEALRRLPAAVVAVWYPITERARVDEFHRGLRQLSPPPTVAVELDIAGDGSQVRMKGCGLLVLNPPWRVEDEIRAVLPLLVDRLALDGGAGSRIVWLAPEK